MEKSGIASCQSVEISARDTILGRSLHITAYSPRFSQEVSAILQNTREGKEQMIAHQIIKLQALGFNIQAPLFFQDIQKLGRNKSSANKFDIVTFLFQTLSNKKLADRLTQTTDISKEAFFLRCLKESGDLHHIIQSRIPEYEPTLDICKNIQEQNNAILALAHPNITFKGGISECREQVAHYIKNA